MSKGLITPDMIEEACISLLKRRHPEHLALLEREIGLSPQTIERLATIDLLAGEGFRLRSDKPPAVLLGVFGTAQAPEPTKNWTLDLVWTLALQIVVVGIDRADVIKRRGWYALTIAQCLYRLPRASDPVDALRLTDIDFTNGAEERTQRTVGEAQLLFDVTVRDAIPLDMLPLDDTDWEPGSPGGPPDGDYGTLVPWPDVETVTINVEKAGTVIP
jgi:hypothetical protein